MIISKYKWIFIPKKITPLSLAKNFSRSAYFKCSKYQRTNYLVNGFIWFNFSIVSILFYQHIKLQFKDKITFRMYFYFLKFSQKIPKLSVWSPQWFVKNNPRFYFEKKNSLDFYFEIERCTFNWKIYNFFLQNSIPKKKLCIYQVLINRRGFVGRMVSVIWHGFN